MMGNTMLLSRWSFLLLPVNLVAAAVVVLILTARSSTTDAFVVPPRSSGVLAYASRVVPHISKERFITISTPIASRNSRRTSSSLHMAVNVSDTTTTTSSAVNGAAVDDESSSSSKILIPRPPSYPPPASRLSGDTTPLTLQEEYDELKTLQDDKVRNVEYLEFQIAELQQALKQKTAALDGSSDQWSLEKTSLLAKIAELTSSFTKQKEDKEELENERERLEREVGLLQNQMEQAMNALRSEQQGAAEIRSRLADVEDALEFQQMEFNKEKSSLEATLQQERKRLEDIVRDWEQDKSRFKQERKKIEDQLVQEKKQLEEAEATWNQNQLEFEEQEAALRTELANQAELLKQRSAELSVERAEYQKDRAELRKEVESERVKVLEVKEILEEERKRFSTVQSDLESLIKVEQKKVSDLSSRLEQEKARFESEKSRLERRIEQEQTRLKEVEERLAEERIVFATTEKELQQQLAEEIRLRKLKKRQMNDRFTAIRQELTALWESAKRDARKEKNALTAKYEKEIDDMKSSMTELEKELAVAKQASAATEQMVKELEKQRDRAVAERDALDARYIGMLSQRNREIASLQSNLAALRTIVEEKDELLERYQSSYRQLFALSLKLTGKRIKQPASRVAGWIRNRRGRKQSETTISTRGVVLQDVEE